MIASFDPDKALQELRRVPAQLNSQSSRPVTKPKYVESKSDKLRAEDQKSGDGNEPEEAARGDHTDDKAP